MTEQSGTLLSGNIYTLVAFISYIALILAIGVFSSRFSSMGINEFFLGGRKMNKFVVALSAVASGRSSWLLLGVTGMAYIRGISAIWAVAGYIAAEYLMFIFAAPVLRRQTEFNDDLTVSDYFSSRFNDKTNVLRLVSAIIIIVFMTAYISAQFVGGGKAFSASFNISPDTGVIFTAFIVLIYTLVGGFLAVSLTDVLQAVFMLGALFILPIAAIIDFGGIDRIVSALQIYDSSFLDPFSLGTGAMIGFLGIGLGSPGNPHILVRYMSIQNPDELKFSAYVGTFWNTVMALSAIVIGLVGRAYFNTVDMLPYSDSENLFPFLANQHLHHVLFGIVIASILAAIMSTADSMLLVCASAVIRDLYQKVIAPGRELTQKQLVKMSRIIILAIVIISLLFGYLASNLVFWLVLFAWGGLGAAFGPTILLSLFWKKTTRGGVLAGFISGVITVIVWNQAAYLKSIMYELVPAFVLSFATTIIFSLISNKLKYKTD